MARIQSYTADLASARGNRGRVQEGIDISTAVRPAAALERLGDTMQQAGAQVAAIADQRQREKEAKWLGESSEQLSRVLIEWQDKNKDREDFGEAYRTFADEQVAEYTTAAPNSRARDAFKLHVLPSINRDWEGALKRGEQNRFAAFDASESKASETINANFRARINYGETEAAREVLTHDLALQKERIAVFYKGAPKVAAAMKEQATVGAILGAVEVDPAFAKELLDSSRDIDAQSRAVLLSRINTSQARIGSQEMVARAQARNDALADGLRKGTTVPEPDLSFEKASMDAAQFDKFSHDERQRFKVQNVTIRTKGEVAALNPAARNRKLSEAAAAESGETGLAVVRSLAQMNDALEKEWAADSFSAVTKYNPDVQAAFQAFQKSGRPADENYWRSLAWERLGHAPAGAEKIPPTVGILRPETLALRKQHVQSFQGLPEAERRLLMKDEATGYADALTKGGWQERIKAVQSLNAKFPDERKRAVAIKDIEQLSEGKQHDIQRTLIAAKLAEVNLAAAQFILSGNGRKAFEEMKPEIQKQISDLLSVGVAGSEPSWSLFALASRGANRENQDLVSGFKTALEEVAALNFKNSAPEAVKSALESLIFNRVAKPVMTPSVGSSPGQAILISRTDPATGTRRSDADIQSISARLPYAKLAIKADDLSLHDPEGNPYYADSVPWLYRPGIKELDKGSKELLQEYIVQKGFWISDTDNNGATFYMEGEGGFDFAPVMKGTGKPLTVRYNELAPIPSIKTAAPSTFSGQVAPPFSAPASYSGGAVLPPSAPAPYSGGRK